MRMRMETITKARRFIEDGHPVGSTLIGHQYHQLDTTKYPCWETLKRNGIVRKVAEEVVDWCYSDGGEEAVDHTEIKWNTYEVVGIKA